MLFSVTFYVGMRDDCTCWCTVLCVKKSSEEEDDGEFFETSSSSFVAAGHVGTVELEHLSAVCLYGVGLSCVINFRLE